MKLIYGYLLTKIKECDKMGENKELSSKEVLDSMNFLKQIFDNYLFHGVELKDLEFYVKLESEQLEYTINIIPKGVKGKKFWEGD